MNEKEYREALHKVLDLYLDINGVQESERKTTGDHPTAFLYFCGHVAECSVKIYEKGWEAGSDADKVFESYFDNSDFGDTPIQMAEKLEKYKEELAKNNVV